MFTLLSAFNSSNCVHSTNPSSPIMSDGGDTVCACNMRNDLANGAHVVILRLSLIIKCIKLLHNRNPSSRIPEVCLADNLRRDVANGAHVVINLLLSTYNSLIVVHDDNPSSPIILYLFCKNMCVINLLVVNFACNICNDFANGAHVVTYSLSVMFNSAIFVQNLRLISDMVLMHFADSVCSVVANGSGMDIGVSVDVDVLFDLVVIRALYTNVYPLL